MEKKELKFNDYNKQQDRNINDYLPSDIIDEIEISPKAKGISFSNQLIQNSEDAMSTLYSSDSAKEISNRIKNRKTGSSNQLTTYKNVNNLFHSMFNNPPRTPTPRMVYSDNNVIGKVVDKGLNLNNIYNSNNNYILYPNCQPQYSFKSFNNYQGNININQSNSNIDNQSDPLLSQINFWVNKNSTASPLSAILDQINPVIFIQLIKTSKGSRYFQKLLSHSQPSQKEIDFILKIVTMNLKEIFCDYYGNYFLQKFLPFCNVQQRIFLYQYIQPKFFEIANDICGNHSLQCFILLQNSKEEEEIIKCCVEKDLPILSTSPNSSHVVQKVIKAIKESNREKINEYVSENILELCLNANGICIVKEFISNSINEIYIKRVVSVFELETKRLTFDQYGNFGIQEAIRVYGGKFCGKIIDKVVEQILEFSISKFSSNVVDFVMAYLYNNHISKFLIIVKKIFLGESLNEMLKSKYATYVLENCLILLNQMDIILKKNKDIVSKLVNIRKKIFDKLSNIPCVKDKKKILKQLVLMQENMN